ncbi:MAG TPA: hypothetical protein VKA60_04935 [Blastocatellia bacterium]|nr:hypothetical protein [Blastocatellia bacterium]
MEFDTLEQYRSESETERGGWRGLLGKTLTFAGFIVLANAFIVAMFFRHILAFRYQLICSVLGALVGWLGMWLRGNSREQVWLAMAAAIAAIVTMILMAVMEARFGWWGMMAVLVFIALLLHKLVQRAWKNL